MRSDMLIALIFYELLVSLLAETVRPTSARNPSYRTLLCYQCTDSLSSQKDCAPKLFTPREEYKQACDPEQNEEYCIRYKTSYGNIIRTCATKKKCELIKKQKVGGCCKSSLCNGERKPLLCYECTDVFPNQKGCGRKFSPDASWGISCRSDQGYCTKRVEKDGKTYRGCGTKLDCYSRSVKCCTHDLCNTATSQIRNRLNTTIVLSTLLLSLFALFSKTTVSQSFFHYHQDYRAHWLGR